MYPWWVRIKESLPETITCSIFVFKSKFPKVDCCLITTTELLVDEKVNRRVPNPNMMLV